MKVTRVGMTGNQLLVAQISPYSGKENTMVLEITDEQLLELASPKRRLIQEIFPDLTNEEREFLKTGYTQEDWDAIFNDAEDQDER